MPAEVRHLGAHAGTAASACDRAAEQLSVHAAGAGTLASDVAAHVEQCLRCQADLVQYRRLLRALRSLRTDVLEPAPGMLTEVLSAIEAAGEQRAIRGVLSGRRAAYVGGIAAATAAGAAGAIVLVARNRRLRLAS